MTAMSGSTEELIAEARAYVPPRFMPETSSLIERLADALEGLVSPSRPVAEDATNQELWQMAGYKFGHENANPTNMQSWSVSTDALRSVFYAGQRAAVAHPVEADTMAPGKRLWLSDRQYIVVPVPVEPTTPEAKP